MTENFFVTSCRYFFNLTRRNTLLNAIVKYFTVRTHIQSFFPEFFYGGQPLVVDVILEKILKLAKPVRNPGHQLVHPTQIVVLVRVKKVLELQVEDFFVFLNENTITGLE